MDRQIRNLLVKAFKGSGSAYRRLGIVFLRGKRYRKDRQLAYLFLQKAAELGDEKGYFLYHKIFFKKKKVIDDMSYEALYREYRMMDDFREKKRLAMYLELGTKEQKQKTFKLTLLI